MHKAERRELLIELLQLIAAIEGEGPRSTAGAGRAAILVYQGRDSEAVAALRDSPSAEVAAVTGLLETHLMDEMSN